MSMDLRSLTPTFAVAPQIRSEDVGSVAARGFRSVICNRPDGESPDQPNYVEIERACQAIELEVAYLPVQSGKVTDENVREFGMLLERIPKPTLAYCQTGMRSATLWSLSEAARGQPMANIVAITKAAGYDMTRVARRIVNGGRVPMDGGELRHEVVIVGGGAAGIA